MASVLNRVGFRFFPGVLQLLRSLGVEIVESEIQSIDMHQQAGLNGERRSSRAKASPNLDVSIFDPLPDDPFEAFKLENDKVPDWATAWSNKGIHWTTIPPAELWAKKIIHTLIRSEKLYLNKLLVLRFWYKPQLILNTLATEISIGADYVLGCEDIYHANKKLLHDPLLSCLTLQETRMSTIVDIVNEWWEKSKSLYIKSISRYSNFLSALNSAKSRRQSFRHFVERSQKDHRSQGFSARECLLAPYIELDNMIDALQSIPDYAERQWHERFGPIDDVYRSIKSVRGSLSIRI